MIRALLQYGQDRGLISRPGYAKKTIRWILDFDETGASFTGAVTSDKEFCTAPDFSFSELIALGAQRGQASHFLIAYLGTFVGWGKDAEAEIIACARRATLAGMLAEAATADPTFSNLSIALLDDRIARKMRAAVVSTKPVAKPTDLATVRVGGRFPVEDCRWHEWWDGFRSSLKKPSSNEHVMACFGTGELVEPEQVHPKLKKLSGVGLSQPYAPIITFDKEAFTSYGLEQAQNAAMGVEAAKAYVDALDDLLEKSVIFAWRRPKPSAPIELARDHVRLGGTRLAYWYVGPARARAEVEEECDLIALTLGSAQKDRAPADSEDDERILTESRLRMALDRIRSGKAAQPISDVRFCILALSGAGGRVMLRDFIEGSVHQLAEATETWFADLALDTYWGRPGRAPSLEKVLTAPLPVKKRDQDYLKWVAPCGAWRQALWRGALTAGQLPGTAAARALLAHNNTIVKGDLVDKEKGPEAQRTSRLRLALVKAYLIRKGTPMKPALDPEHPIPAYHCGRLLAAYDSLQRAALGDVGSGVVQRYYGGALTNPSGVFGQLSRMAQTHLSKLEGGLAYTYTQRIAEIHNGIRREGNSPATYPPALTLDQQALFALGFWHQIAATNREIAEASAAKKSRHEATMSEQTTPEDK